jgi:hypothetical protein
MARASDVTWTAPEGWRAKYKGYLSAKLGFLNVLKRPKSQPYIKRALKQWRTNPGAHPDWNPSSGDDDIAVVQASADAMFAAAPLMRKSTRGMTKEEIAAARLVIRKGQQAKQLMFLIDYTTAADFLRQQGKKPPKFTAADTPGSNLSNAYYATSIVPVLSDRRKNLAKREKELAEELQAARRKNVQTLLLNNMDILVAANGIIATSYEKDKRLQDVISYFDEPDALVNKIINPMNACSFVNATPSQLGSLLPKLQFFLTDKNGDDQPVYFSDHVKAEKMIELSNIRANGNLAEMLSSKDQRGTNVGVRSFDWTFDNKHEGDRVVKANLVLYFGSLAELVNNYYLQFLFTTGQPRPESTPQTLGNPQTAESKTLAAMGKKLIKWKDALKSGKNPDVNVRPYSKAIKHNNFRQLKVSVGWARPKGERVGSDFATAQALYPVDFEEVITSMEKVLLLNMVSYKLNFMEEGQVEVSIDYVASIDSYFAKSTTDVLRGEHLSTSGHDPSTSPVRLVVDPPDGTWSRWFGSSWGRTTREEAVYEGGYIKNQITQGKRKKITTVDADGKSVIGFDVTEASVKFEIDFLRLKIDYIERTAKKQKGYSQPGSTNSDVQSWRSRLQAAEAVYSEVQAQFRSQKYSTFMETLLVNSRIYVASMRPASSSDQGRTNRKFFRSYPPSPLATAAARAKLRKVVSDDGKTLIENRTLDPTNVDQVKQGFEKRPGQLPVFYFRLGDLVDTAVINSGQRDDTHIVLGSFDPSLAGLPASIKTKYYGIADIPISLDYFGHWFMENVISKERETYPLRHFLNDLMNGLASDVINFNDMPRQARLYFGFTNVSTTGHIPPGAIITKQQDLEKYVTATGRDPETGLLRQSSKGFVINNYYLIFAKQLDIRKRTGDRCEDEKIGIYHLYIGADRGILKGVAFKEKAMPQYRAMRIENSNVASEAAGALVLPQDASLKLFGNSLFQNGQLIYINAELGLGRDAARRLKLGGYYRIYKVQNSIRPGSYETTLECMYDDPRSSPGAGV